MSLEALERALLETAVGVLNASYPTDEQGSYIRTQDMAWALEVYRSVLELHIKAVGAGEAEFVPADEAAEEAVRVEKKKGSN